MATNCETLPNFKTLSTSIDLFLCTPEGYANVPVFQYLSYHLNGCDLRLTDEYFKELARIVSPVQLLLARRAVSSPNFDYSTIIDESAPPATYEEYIKHIDDQSDCQTFEQRLYECTTMLVRPDVSRSEELEQQELPVLDPLEYLRVDEYGIDSVITKDDEYSLINNNLKEVGKEFSVEELCDALPDKSIPLVIYAPPHSGKTSFAKTIPYVWDTDNIRKWTTISPTCVVTNVPSMVKKARKSLMIIPDRDVFIERCKKRNLQPTNQWYDDVLDVSQHATVVEKSDQYVSEVLRRCIRDLCPAHDFLEHC